MTGRNAEGSFTTQSDVGVLFFSMSWQMRFSFRFTLKRKTAATTQATKTPNTSELIVPTTWKTPGVICKSAKGSMSRIIAPEVY